MRGAFSKWAVAALALIVVAGLAALRITLGPEVPVTEVKHADIVQSIVATGRVMTPRRVQIAAIGVDRVIAIPVAEGERVRRGQVLVELDAADERAALALSQAALAQSEARIRQLRDLSLPAAEQTLRQAEATAKQTTAQHERSKALRAQGFIGDAQLDDARRAAEVAESQVNAARLQVTTARSGGSDHALAQAALEQARANLNAATTRIEQTLIRAPVNGVLIARSVEPGNVVQAGRELMVLAPEGDTQVVAQLDERHLSRLKLGLPARVSADAFPAQRLDATLVYINPGVDALRGTVEVKLRIANTPDYLRQDMTVSIDIEVARRPGVLVAPTLTLRSTAADKAWVLVERDGRAQRQEVKLGLSGGDNAEILDGLKAGDRLIPTTGPRIEPGQRIRPVLAEPAAK